TPIRSDGEHSVWLAYDDYGRIDHPEDGTYTLTYGQAVDLGYCRPVTFHRHQGEFSVDLADGVKVQISGDQAAVITGRLARIPALQRALGFYRLATTPLFEPDGHTPLLTGYQASMVEWGNQKLVELRDRMPDAGGLVIAPSIEMAEYMSDLIERIDGEKPMLVHSNVSNADGKIDAFRNTDKKWLVSVAMVSEGIDIQRLRVLLYLPSAQTELAFRQAVGRVVRTRGYDDDTRAYAIIPAFSTFEQYARRIENEMSATARAQHSAPRTRRCPVFIAECGLRVKTCHGCGHEFPERAIPSKVCDDCQTVNPMTAVTCRACGSSFTPSFVLTLDEALRTGAIARGMD
ncbi:MAG: helicase-related protein, partial [Pseudomonadota bacterium]|nr:helicase-related protein [Pseudomonadota bacterium]